MARFELCTCGRHGRIILADGFQAEFCFKEHGFHFAQIGVREERFSSEESEQIIKDIAESSLPTTAQEANRQLLWNTEAWNQTYLQYPKVRGWSKQRICKLLHKKIFKDDEIPSDLIPVIERIIKGGLPVQ